MNNTELFNAMYPRTEDKVGLALTGVTTLVTFVSALNSARKGDYNKALFKAVMWLGFTNNNNAALAMRYDKATRPRALGMK